MAHEAFVVYGAKLVKDDLAALCHEAAGDAERVRAARRGERRYDRSSQMSVELVWGDDDARPGLPNLAAARGVEIDEEDLPAPNRSRPYHVHSSSSNRLGAGASRSRSPSSLRSF